MRKLVRETVVTKCDECPWGVSLMGLDQCNQQGRELIDMEEIPDWCDLPKCDVITSETNNNSVTTKNQETEANARSRSNS